MLHEKLTATAQVVAARLPEATAAVGEGVVAAAEQLAAAAPQLGDQVASNLEESAEQLGECVLAGGVVGCGHGPRLGGGRHCNHWYRKGSARLRVCGMVACWQAAS